MAAEWQGISAEDRAPFEAQRHDTNLAKMAALNAAVEIVRYWAEKQQDLPDVRRLMPCPTRPDASQSMSAEEVLARRVPLEPDTSLVAHAASLPDRVRAIPATNRAGASRTAADRDVRKATSALQKAQATASLFEDDALQSGSVDGAALLDAAPNVTAPDGVSPPPKTLPFTSLDEAATSFLGTRRAPPRKAK